MDLLDQMAEAKIREAQSRGELDNLPGAGQPLLIEADNLLDPSLRVAYRVLKNSGFVPPEVAQRREIESIESLLRQVTDPQDRKPLIAQLFRRVEQLDANSGMRADSRAHYYSLLLDRLAARS